MDIPRQSIFVDLTWLMMLHDPLKYDFDRGWFSSWHGNPDEYARISRCTRFRVTRSLFRCLWNWNLLALTNARGLMKVTVRRNHLRASDELNGISNIYDSCKCSHIDEKIWMSRGSLKRMWFSHCEKKSRASMTAWPHERARISEKILWDGAEVILMYFL